MRDLKTLNLHLIFYLLELANLRLYKLTLNQIFAFLNGENCKVNSERTHYSASKLAHVVSYETDTDEIIKAIVPWDYDIEKYNKSFSFFYFYFCYEFQFFLESSAEVFRN